MEIRFSSWIACRNASCEMMAEGFIRHGCKEGFVMQRGTEVISLVVI